MLMSLAPVSIVPRTPERRMTGPMLWALLALAGFVVVRLSGLDHAGFSFCYFKTLTGHACMTCGSTRAFGHLSHFDVQGAFAIQPLVTAGTLALLLWGVVDAILLVFGRRTQVKLGDRGKYWATVAVVALAAANWIYLLAIGA